ncbi:hypothetical protein CCGE525_02590 [Rhizobium jaguaris]|uniref:Uncharacterized protein n=1 Tax=Rhizobium jaguaris TaxID=1312183 RepID=A0A387FH23_9HYPH|nr:hypothetical protein CCGE525_02590 [Rhizobium jaguaris]
MQVVSSFHFRQSHGNTFLRQIHTNEILGNPARYASVIRRLKCSDTTQSKPTSKIDILFYIFLCLEMLALAQTQSQFVHVHLDVAFDPISINCNVLKRYFSSHSELLSTMWFDQSANWPRFRTKTIISVLIFEALLSPEHFIEHG